MIKDNRDTNIQPSDLTDFKNPQSSREKQISAEKLRRYMFDGFFPTFSARAATKVNLSSSENLEILTIPQGVSLTVSFIDIILEDTTSQDGMLFLNLPSVTGNTGSSMIRIFLLINGEQYLSRDLTIGNTERQITRALPFTRPVPLGEVRLEVKILSLSGTITVNNSFGADLTAVLYKDIELLGTGIDVETPDGDITLDDGQYNAPSDGVIQDDGLYNDIVVETLIDNGYA